MVQLKIKGKGPIAIGILLETSDGRILCQLRDNNPEIHYPGCWSIFTGGLDESDWDGNLESSLKKGILRELSEELNIINENEEIPFILQSKIKLIDEGVYFDSSTDYSDYQYVFHAILDVPVSKLKLKEGLKLGLFGEKDIDKLNFAPSYKGAVKNFFARRKQKNLSEVKMPLCAPKA